MNDDGKGLSDETKKFMIAIAALALPILAGLAVLLYFKLSKRNKNTNAPPSIPKDASFYDFERNTGIKWRKASVAYHNFLSLTEKEKEMMTLEVYDELKANLEKYDVNFTGTENIGFIYVLAKMLSSTPEKLNELCERKVTEADNQNPSLQNLYVELACHIKMRKEGENISLGEYEAYFYSIAGISVIKNKMMDISDLNERAKKEAHTVKTQQVCDNLNRKINGFLPFIHIDKNVDDFIPLKRNE